MSIFFYKGLTRNPEIGNTLVWVLPNIWRLAGVRDTKFSKKFFNNKLNIYDANFTNNHHMVQSNFKGINLRNLCEKTVLTKCISTLNDSNTRYPNTIKTVIRTFDLSNSFNFRNSLAISYNNCFMYRILVEFDSSRLNSSSFLLVKDHLHIKTT